MTRNKIPVLVTIFSPIIWASCIAWLNSMAYVAEETQAKTFDYHDLNPMEHCIGTNCITVGYAILGDR